MNLQIAQNTDANTNLAFFVSELSQLNSSLFSEKEWNFLANALEDKPDQWVSVNQYNKYIFVYRYKKHLPGNNTFSESCRKAGALLVETLNTQKLKNINVNALGYEALVAEGMVLANYKYLKYFSDTDKKASSLTEMYFENIAEADLKEVQNLTDAVCYSRDLVNTPVWDLTADQLADAAKESGKKYGYRVEVLNKKKIESLKMGGLLAVNKGSIDDPAFIILEHKPKNPKNKKPIVLVGKGVVYDTGGLSLKPSAFMDTMKCDMGGAAAVMGALQTLAANKSNTHVVGLIPATDNRPGGNAVTPGDVITMMSGKTVEVLNTDAEGRLILADALHYAKKYKPELVIDLATLTGAAAAAIGRYGIVAMGDASDEHWTKITTSGENTYERVVRFPFWEEYDELIKSDIADIKNLGGKEGGAITAGKFLANFTDYPYIHLDIAGPAFIETNDGYQKKGATGVGVRLLYDLIKNY